LTKTVVISIPRLEPHRPPPGPAIIAKICEQQGHTVTAYDLNIKFFNYCKNQNIDYHGFDQVWNQFADFDTQQYKILEKFLDVWCKRISLENYDYIMIGIFGISGSVFAREFLNRLRPLTGAKIIIGGMGAGTAGLTDPEDCLGYRLKNEGLVDTYVVGEGEGSIVKVLNNETGPGINNTEVSQIDNLDSLPQPDYKFFNLEEYDYLFPNEKEVFITGSRGCVRKCTYCDIERYWPKFRYRSGQNIANEIIDNYERFGITRFYFTDSLINGSFKAFNDMCEKLSCYKFDHPLSWSGQFIFRDKKSIPKDHYELVKAAGADILFVGIETGSDRVRFDMGKKFTNEDIDFQFEECSKNGIHVIPLMFTGYITETIEDHRENLQAFQRWQRYVADGTIVGAELGTSLIILPGAPVERMIDSHGLTFVVDDNMEPDLKLWWSEANPELTIKERIRRKLEVHETAIKYAWPVWRQASRLRELKELILKHELHQKDIQKFYKLVPTENQTKIATFSKMGEL
jgi:radical SAM superfamily enzyme YgiQ (UPF0313 family)